MIADVAKTFGLTAIAESVETLEQLACVEDVGCDSVQGFSLSEPLEAEAVTSYLYIELLPLRLPLARVKALTVGFRAEAGCAQNPLLGTRDSCNSKSITPSPS